MNAADIASTVTKEHDRIIPLTQGLSEAHGIVRASDAHGPCLTDHAKGILHCHGDCACMDRLPCAIQDTILAVVNHDMPLKTRQMCRNTSRECSVIARGRRPATGMIVKEKIAVCVHATHAAPERGNMTCHAVNARSSWREEGL